MLPEDFLFRLSVEQYHEMIRAGILKSGDPVELIEGYLVFKMTKNPAHRVATRLTSDALRRLLPAGWFVDTQEPVTTEISEPEPDVTVVRGQPRDYVQAHPGPREIAIAIEVADTSLAWYRGGKRLAYARAGIAAYWIVNIPDGQIEVYTQPTGPADVPTYLVERTYRPEEQVPVIIEGRDIGTIAVRDLLP